MWSSSTTSCHHFIYKMDIPCLLIDISAKTLHRRRPDCINTIVLWHKAYLTSNLCKIQSSSDICKTQSPKWHPPASRWCQWHQKGVNFCDCSCQWIIFFPFFGYIRLCWQQPLHRPWLLHHYDRLCLHQLICNNSDQSVRVITVIQDTPAITAGGNRGGDKGRHQKSGDERREDEEAHVFEFSRNRPLRSYYDWGGC